MPDVTNLRAIIVDDELNAIANLKKLLASYCRHIEVIDTATGADSAAILVNELKPDVLFLDISMPKKNGFELLNMLRFMPLIVFVTAHEKYALNAIKASAVDFLLKPVDVNELIKVEEKLLRIQTMRNTGFHENYSSVVGNLVSMLQHPGAIRNITLPDNDGYKIVSIDDVLYLEGENNYTSVYLHNQQKVVLSKTLKEYEYLVSESGFVRIHKSSIVNLRHLRKITVDDEIQVIMDDDRVLAVSRRRAPELMEKAKQYTR